LLRSSSAICANLRLPELTRALRALSSAYVERRHTVGRGGPLDSAGKRAAFALFYAPLHFLTATYVIHAPGSSGEPPPSSVLDIRMRHRRGRCAGPLPRADADGAGHRPSSWAVDEARWTYRMLKLKGSARRAM
jgi:hypothetical protein